MAKPVQAVRLVAEADRAEPTLAELLDPVALEARLVIARERRAMAIAMRNTNIASDDAATEFRTEPPSTAETAPLPAYAQTSDERTSPRNSRKGSDTKPLILAAMFVVGLVGGAAAVLLAPPEFLELVSGAPAPAAIQAAPPILPSTASSSPMPAAMIAAPAPPPAVEPGIAGNPLARAVPVAVAALPGAPAPSAVELPPEGRAAAHPMPAVGQWPKSLGLIAGSSQPEFPSSPMPAVARAPVPDGLRPPAAEGRVRDIAAQLASAVAPSIAEPLASLPQRGRLATASIVVHFPPEAAMSATLAVETLLAAGAADADAVQVELSISSPNVRYFHATDKDAAVQVATSLASALGVGAPEARDFTEFRPQPEPGLIEVWLAGDTSAGSVKSGSRRPADGNRQTAVVAKAPRPVAERNAQADLQRAVEQMLLERKTRMRRP